jgi:hypothetical protein
MKKKFDPNKIPIWLRRTPEQQAGDRAYQDELRSAQGPGMRPNPTEQHLLRAAAVRRSAEAQLRQLRLDKNPDPVHVEAAEAQLAEALAMQGHYAEAAELHPEPEHAERYAAIAAAIDRPDDAPTCNCKVESANNEILGQPVIITGEHVSEMVFSPKHRRMMPLVACANCPGMNVKPAPEHLTNRLRQTEQSHREEKQRRQNGA